MGQLHIRIQSSLLSEISVLLMSVLTSEMLGTERVSGSGGEIVPSVKCFSHKCEGVNLILSHRRTASGAL